MGVAGCPWKPHAVVSVPSTAFTWESRRALAKQPPLARTAPGFTHPFLFSPCFFCPWRSGIASFVTTRGQRIVAVPAVGSLQDGAGQGKEGDGVAFWVPSHRIVGGCHVP